MFFNPFLIKQRIKRQIQLNRIELMLEALTKHLNLNVDTDLAVTNLVSEQVLTAIKQNDQLAAIKQYRQDTGAGLAEAKVLVEQIQQELAR